jgi:hypothetical protein
MLDLIVSPRTVKTFKVLRFDRLEAKLHDVYQWYPYVSER